MRFSLKFALSAILAKTIAAELTHMEQTQQLPNELDTKYQTQRIYANQPELQGYQEHNPYEAGRAAYAGYSMPDLVQQYASSHGGNVDSVHPNAFHSDSFDPNSFNPDAYNPDSNAEASNEVPAFIEPGYNGYSDFGPYGSPNGYNSDGSFSVQNGYEGFLVPGPPGQKAVVAREPLPNPLGSISALTSSIPETMRQTTSLLGRSFAFLLGLLGVTVFGGGITTAICTFTPLCTISFAIPFLPALGVRSGLRDVAETLDMSDTANMLAKSISKLAKMQPDEKANFAAKASAQVPEADIKSSPTESIRVDKVEAVTAKVEAVTAKVETVAPK